MTTLSCAECGVALKPHGNRKYDLCRRHAHAATERLRRASDPEKGRASARRRYYADVQRARSRSKDYVAQNRAKVAEYQRLYRAANREAITEYFRAYNEQRAEYRRAWARLNSGTPERRLKKRAAGHARRAALADAPGACSPEQLQARWDYYGGKCWMCGGMAEAIDHVIAIALGGSNWPANLRPACTSCNSAKGARPWRLYLNQKEAA